MVRNVNDDPMTYRTITGGRISLSNMTRAEYDFLSRVAGKYSARQNWTRFAAWWNAEFREAGLDPSSPVFRICQDLEARLGIDQGRVAPPDYRDYLVELIDTQFGSRQAFCQATGVDPGQLSRVLASRGDLSMKVLQNVLQVLHARLVVQTDEDARVQSSVEPAVRAIQSAIAQPATDDEPDSPLTRSTMQQMIAEELGPLREQVQRLEDEIHAPAGTA